jgi:hypothetical protein
MKQQIFYQAYENAYNEENQSRPNIQAALT